MKTLVKKAAVTLGIQTFLKLKKESIHLASGSTVLIHVGKCGGRTVRDGIDNATRNLVDHEVHIRKPVCRKDLKYIIVARGPISRLRSAFRWRYKLVVTEAVQRERFDGEHDILVKYQDLNTIAEALYHPDGTPNLTAHKDIRKIHHIHEDIAFYLGDLLKTVSPEQITAVLMQENLDDDILRVFGYQNSIKSNYNPVGDEPDDLSSLATQNLMRFFANDYVALTQLYCWGKISKEVLLKAI